MHALTPPLVAAGRIQNPPTQSPRFSALERHVRDIHDSSRCFGWECWGAWTSAWQVSCCNDTVLEWARRQTCVSVSRTTGCWQELHSSCLRISSRYARMHRRCTQWNCVSLLPARLPGRSPTGQEKAALHQHAAEQVHAPICGTATHLRPVGNNKTAVRGPRRRIPRTQRLRESTCHPDRTDSKPLTNLSNPVKRGGKLNESMQPIRMGDCPPKHRWQEPPSASQVPPFFLRGTHCLPDGTGCRRARRGDDAGEEEEAELA
ncbi:hypothetical protein T484DRAFT_1928982 [Baffinella frigidus]|nr:hypothetical protein T484DRAFT_1928982 [Cryptophyta sp. CCMP2293]